MKKLVCLSIAVMLAIPATSSAFNGLRRGFVLGGGLGVAPLVKHSIKNTRYSEEKAGGGANLALGYAWDEMNMIVWEANVAGYSEDGRDIAQGYSGPAWYHYFGPVGQSFFTAVGLGLYYYQVDDTDADPSIGLMAGVGYEFARHVQFAFYVHGGETSDPGFPNEDYTHTTINLLIQAFAF